MSRAVLASSLVLCAALLGCDAARDRYCKLDREQVVASTEAKTFDAVALAARAGGAVLAWSDAGGTFARRLDTHGAAVGAIERVGERCDGGVALAAVADQCALACVRRAVPRDLEQPGSAVVHALSFAGERIAASELARYEPAGSLSDGVALAWVPTRPGGQGDQVLALAWHDASPDVHRVWFSSDVQQKRPAQIVSSTGSLASGPVLAVRSDRLALAWSERVARGDALESNTMLWLGKARVDAEPAAARVLAESGGKKTLVSSKWIEPWPQLTFLDDGLVVGYRAPGHGAKKPGLHIGWIEGGELSSGDSPPHIVSPHRVGRADGVGRPTLTACMGGIVTATPRSYSGDYFIGINWLSTALQHPRREQQFYEDARAFTHAAGACLGTHALIALAELPQLDRPKAELHVATYTCE